MSKTSRGISSTQLEFWCNHFRSSVQSTNIIEPAGSQVFTCLHLAQPQLLPAAQVQVVWGPERGRMQGGLLLSRHLKTLTQTSQQLQLSQQTYPCNLTKVKYSQRSSLNNSVLLAGGLRAAFLQNNFLSTWWEHFSPSGRREAGIHVQ